jgi:uncharacterized membrane protein HdeD (DUF308 family)
MTAGTTSTSPDAYDPADSMSAVLARNWWALALRGVFAVLFGLVALFATGPTILSLVLLFSAYMLVDGIFGIVAGARAAGRGQRWGWLVLEGLANIAIGVIAFLWPGLTVLAFVLMLAAWSLVTGALMIVAAFRLNPEYGRGWLIFSGVVSLLFGIALVVAPMIGAVVLTWWLGAYAIVFGIGLLVLAFKLRSHKDDLASTAGPAAPQGV